MKTQLYISDAMSGNNDGSIDPGETITINL